MLNVSRRMAWSVLFACIPLACSKKLSTLVAPETSGRFTISFQSGADNTDAIQQQIDTVNYVFLPAGVYYVDASRGIRLRQGTRIEGAGKYQSLLVAKYKTAGSIFRRDFNSGASNAYVFDVKISNVGVVLNHGGLPAGSYQVAFDFRHITRSSLVGVFAGNCNQMLPGRPEAPTPIALMSGYGVLFGNIPHGDTAYAGGEVNQVRDSHICGAKKGISIDDSTLSPRSSAHAALIYNNVIEKAHWGVVQESVSGAGSTFRSNHFQKIGRAPNSTANSYAMAVAGYAGHVVGNEVVDSTADYFLVLHSTARAISARANLAGPGVSRSISIGNRSGHFLLDPVGTMDAKVFRSSRAVLPDFRTVAVNILDKGAREGEDSTAAIQAAIDDPLNKVYIPPGRFLVNPAVGLKLRSGVEIRGAGRWNSYLIATKVGGSVFGREFNAEAAAKNELVERVGISDLAVVLNRSYVRTSSQSQQIAFDFRNISRSAIVDVFAGNLDASEITAGDTIKGYGVAFGSVLSSQANYVSANGNRVVGSRIWGTYKAVTIDDRDLSGISAAHNTLVFGNDIQFTVFGITQEYKGTFNTAILDNTVQALIPRGPETVAFQMFGRRGLIEGGYTEAPYMNIILRLGPDSTENRAYPILWSQLEVPTCKIEDLGTGNTVRHYHFGTFDFGEGSHPHAEPGS